MPIPKKKVLALSFGHRPAPTAKRLPANYRDNGLRMGIEIECENTRNAVDKFNNTPSSWEMVEDGSLRNGMEFIFKSPLSGEELAGAIHEFFEITKGTGIVANARTSCHIHVDMRESEMEEIRGMVMVYQAAEQAFWSTTHTQRRWTGYCLPLMESQGQIVALLMRTDFPDREVDKLMREVSKYSAFNVVSMRTHGSFEFRHFHNPVDEDELNKWVNFCQAVKIVGTGLAAAAHAADEAVFDWVGADPNRVVEAIFADATLTALCTPVPREQMVEAVEKLLAVCDAVNIKDVALPKDLNRDVAAVLALTNGQIPMFENIPGYPVIRRYKNHANLTEDEQMLASYVFNEVVARGFINNPLRAAQIQDALIMRYNWPACNNAEAVTALANPDLSADELIVRIGKAQYVIMLSVEQVDGNGNRLRGLMNAARYARNVLNGAIEGGNYVARPMNGQRGFANIANDFAEYLNIGGAERNFIHANDDEVRVQARAAAMAQAQARRDELLMNALLNEPAQPEQDEPEQDHEVDDDGNEF